MAKQRTTATEAMKRKANASKRGRPTTPIIATKAEIRCTSKPTHDVDRSILTTTVDGSLKAVAGTAMHVDARAELTCRANVPESFAIAATSYDALVQGGAAPAEAAKCGAAVGLVNAVAREVGEQIGRLMMPPLPAGALPR